MRQGLRAMPIRSIAAYWRWERRMGRKSRLANERRRVARWSLASAREEAIRKLERGEHLLKAERQLFGMQMVGPSFYDQEMVNQLTNQAINGWNRL